MSHKPQRERPAVPVPQAPVALRTVQPRARATRDSLLSAGRMLLAQRDFDELSIADIAGAAGLSVGSFYGRFQDKESFFALLQEQVTAEWLATGRTLLRDADESARAPGALVVDVCAVVVGIFRRNRGFIRSALKHGSTHPETWTPIKRTGDAFVDELTEQMAPMLQHLGPRQRRPRVRFAMQMVFGTCVNAVLHDPGPRYLDDRGFERELARAVSAYLGLGRAMPGR